MERINERTVRSYVKRCQYDYETYRQTRIMQIDGVHADVIAETLGIEFREAKKATSGRQLERLRERLAIARGFLK